jgi:hypothetical protein
VPVEPGDYALTGLPGMRWDTVLELTPLLDGRTERTAAERQRAGLRRAAGPVVVASPPITPPVIPPFSRGGEHPPRRSDQLRGTPSNSPVGKHCRPRREHARLLGHGHQQPHTGTARAYAPYGPRAVQAAGGNAADRPMERSACAAVANYRRRSFGRASLAQSVLPRLPNQQHG